MVQLEVAGDYGKRIFTQKQVRADELRSDGFLPVRLDFSLPFPTELGFRTKFLNRRDIYIDRIVISSVTGGTSR